MVQKINDIINRLTMKINPKTRKYLRKYWSDLFQTWHQCMLGKTQNDTHFDVAMALLSVPVPFCYKPNITSIFDQIRKGRQSYLKRTKCPYCLLISCNSLTVNDV